MSDEGVCRTAPATPGLLNISQIIKITYKCPKGVPFEREIAQCLNCLDDKSLVYTINFISLL